jgi:uncharacterized protein
MDQKTSMNNTLIVFAKAPQPGRVKTRMFSDLSPDQSAELYRAFVHDLLEATRSLSDVRRVIGCDPSARDPYFQSLGERHGVELMDQTGRDLGERMRNALGEAQRNHPGPAVIIGTDSPTLPMGIVREAFDRLRTDELALGPSHDGGYYLIGCAEKIPPIFEEIPWGTDRVLELTLKKITELGVRCALLPFWYDVDTIQDLRFLSAHLEYRDRQGNGPVAPETRRALENLKF